MHRMVTVFCGYWAAIPGEKKCVDFFYAEKTPGKFTCIKCKFLVVFSFQ